MSNIEDDGYSCQIPGVIANRQKNMRLYQRWLGDRALLILECWKDYDFDPKNAPFPEKIPVLFAAYCGCSIVNSEGFFGLFSASEGVLVPEMYQGLRELGFLELASVVQEAIMILGEPFDRNLESRLRKVRDLEGCLDGLDQSFFDKYREIKESFRSECDRQLLQILKDYPRTKT